MRHETDNSVRGGEQPPNNMKQRPSRLEDAFEKMDDNLSELRVDTGKISEKLDNLPTSGTILTWLSIAVIILSAVGFVIKLYVPALGQIGNKPAPPASTTPIVNNYYSLSPPQNALPQIPAKKK